MKKININVINEYNLINFINFKVVLSLNLIAPINFARKRARKILCTLQNTFVKKINKNSISEKLVS